jgi:di/tricarboxylate transporter
MLSSTGSGPGSTDGSKSQSQDNYEPMVCAYVLLVMAVYWMTEALPLPITSLIPIVAFPLAGVLSTVSSKTRRPDWANFRL